MGRPVVVGKEAIIKEGTLKKKIGHVVAYDYCKNEVILIIDPYTQVITNSQNIEQKLEEK